MSTSVATIINTNNVSNLLIPDGEYRPQYKFLNLSDLYIAGYQRKLHQEECKKYLKVFDWRMVGVLLVSVRDGQYWIVDGQHRSVLLQMKGIKKALCQIVAGLTYQEEAELFKKFNSERQSLGRADLFIADYESGNNNARNIVDIMGDYGYYIRRIDEIRSTEQCMKIDAVGAVESAFAMLGADRFKFMFDLISHAWPNDRSAVKRSMIIGMTRFVKKFPEQMINRNHFISRLSKESPEVIMRQATVDCKYSCSCSDRPDAIARIIWKLYNRNLPKRIALLPNEF